MVVPPGTDRRTDRDDIIDLIARLGSWLDGHGGDPTQIYDDAVVVQGPRGETRGIDAVMARVGPAVTRDERSQHLHTDALVEIADDTAIVRANQLVHFCRPRQPPHRTSGLRVEYRLARCAGGWRPVGADIDLEWLIGELPA